MEQPGQEQLDVLGTARPEGRHDVEPVALVGDVHPVEQGQLRRRQPGRERGPLVGTNAGAEVSPELADLTGPGEGR